MGGYVIKCQSLSERARKQLQSYVSESALRLKMALDDTLALGYVRQDLQRLGDLAPRLG